jgi:alkylated DNA repair protein (DNA oxidative demethylase)
MSADLFASHDVLLRLSAGTVLLPGFALAAAPALLAEIEAIAARAPFRGMQTPGGQKMSVTTTSCGQLGWVSDRRGYRYESADPCSHKPWPPMPEAFRQLAQAAAAQAGFASFEPDACLINRYAPGTKMGLHQDLDERDFSAPIVSVSLGLAAIFLLGGLQRSDRKQRIPLHHGDVLVWGGPDRLRFHGVLPVADGRHELTGTCRLNLTFRQAG